MAAVVHQKARPCVHDDCGWIRTWMGTLRTIEDRRRLNPAPEPTPLTADDLRRELNSRRTGQDRAFRPTTSAPYGTQRYVINELEPQPMPPGRMQPNPRVDQYGAGSSGIQPTSDTPRSPSPEVPDTDSDSASTGGRHAPHTSLSSFQSQTSYASYKSTPQEPFTQPRFDTALPKFRRNIGHPIDPNDRTLIERSEFYARVAEPGCPFCGDDHRGYRCLQFKQLNLQMRWYHALNMDVCLNCLRFGHSSFRCFGEGACKSCGTRHNSVLCPRNPDNDKRR